VKLEKYRGVDSRPSMRAGIFRRCATSITFFSAVLASACSTVPASAPDYKREAPGSNGLVNLYVYRIGAFPSKRSPSIYIDERELFDPPEGSYTVVRLKPGKHAVATRWSWDTGAPNLSFVIDVPPSDSYYLKLSGDFKGSGLVPGMIVTNTSFARQVDQEIAEQELRNCCRFIPNRF
jgi:hypothetical protein